MTRQEYWQLVKEENTFTWWCIECGEPQPVAESTNIQDSPQPVAEVQSFQTHHNPTQTMTSNQSRLYENFMHLLTSVCRLRWQQCIMRGK